MILGYINHCPFLECNDVEDVLISINDFYDKHVFFNMTHHGVSPNERFDGVQSIG